MDVLRGERVVLRPLRPEDAEDVAAACADGLIQRFLPHLPSPYTLADAHWWITEGAPATIAAGGWAYGLADPDTDRIIGGGGMSRRRTSGGEIGKKLDFLLQEMNRETNTMLSKTNGIGEQGLTITETALAVKADIEKIREQSLNLE